MSLKTCFGVNKLLAIWAMSLALDCTAAYSKAVRPTLINGTEADPALWKQVVKIQSGNAGCTATVVGPRVILTAAHCAANGATARFQIDGKQFTATMAQSPYYASRDHDIAVGATSEDIPVTPIPIGGVPSAGQRILLMGYGCTTRDGRPSDGKLRMGQSTVSSVQNDRFGSNDGGNVLLCPGDSGGPALIDEAGKISVLGVNSAVGVDPATGDIIGPNYNGRTDGSDHRSFLTSFAQQRNVDICGVTKQCGASPPPPPPPGLSCTLTAVPASIDLGDSLRLVLSASGATSGRIDGVTATVPNGELRVTPASSGSFTSKAEVTGQNGQVASCEAQYRVNPKAPGNVSCTLTAIPSSIVLGQSLTLELKANGAVDYGSIDGTSVPVPTGSRLVTPNRVGEYSAVGYVRGSGGSANCFGDYKVEQGAEPPPPDLPAYSVIPTYCGADALAASSGISQVCLGELKADPSMNATGLKMALQIQYASGAREVMPIVARRPMAGRADRDELALFANGLVQGAGMSKLDTRVATLVKRPDGTPSSVEGRSQTNKNFRVSLQPR